MLLARGDKAYTANRLAGGFEDHGKKAIGGDEVFIKDLTAHFDGLMGRPQGEAADTPVGSVFEKRRGIVDMPFAQNEALCFDHKGWCGVIGYLTIAGLSNVV